MGQLLTDALIIKNETAQGANTALRVGTWMQNAATEIEETPSALAFIDIISGQSGTLIEDDWARLGADCTLLFQRNGMTLFDAGAGIIKYNGINKWFRFSVIVALTAQSNRRIHVGIFKNAELVAGSEFEQSTGSQTEITLPCQFVLQATNNDEFGVYIKCSNNNSTYQLDNLNVIINEF